MRLFNLSLLLGAAALVTGQALIEEPDEDAVRENTWFNGKAVPPMTILNPDNWKAELGKSRYTMVKGYRYAALSPCRSVWFSLSEAGPDLLSQSILPTLL